MKHKKYRLRGMTLIELLIASTISAVVLAGLFISLGNVYFSQKKINATHSFASESRFLMERVAQLIRNNTIDYDRFFIEVGPDPDAARLGLEPLDPSKCQIVSINQVPEEFWDEMPDLLYNTGSFYNQKLFREFVGYENFFYWNIVPDEAIPRYRNLGGKKPNLDDSEGDDVPDPCVQAWHGELSTLYLINKERTERVAIQRVDEEVEGGVPEETSGRLQIQRELGVDSNNDGLADQWGVSSLWDDDTGCVLLYYPEANPNALVPLGSAMDAFDEKTCLRAHDWVSISPRAIDVTDFEFIPGPDREPFLSYRITEAQVQPHVFLRLNTELRNPSDFGLPKDTNIVLTQQTAASSRVFGDIR